MPWLAYHGDAEVADEPILSLLARRNGGQPGTEFLEALYGHLMMSGNAYVDVARLAAESRGRCHLLRPDRVRVIEGRDGWPRPMTTAWVLPSGAMAWAMAACCI